MTVDELQVLITANTEELRKEINNANKSISGLQKSTSKGTSGMMSVFSKLKTGIIALGIGKVIKDSIQSGVDAIESDSMFDTVLGKYADSIRSWSDEVSNTLGLNAYAMRNNAGVIYNMTSSMGVAEDSALKMSKGISLLSEDMASFYNLDSTEAFNKLRAGITGETEPLKALGILVDENTVKQVAYSEGIAENGAELTQQQKVLARYVAILKQTGNAQGDLARTLNSPANQLRQLKQQVTNLGIAFSNLLMPVLKAVLPYVTAFTKAITQAVTSLATFLGIGKDESVSEETEKISNNVGGLGSGMDEANKKAKKLKSTLAGFDEMNVLQDNSSDSDSSSGSGAVGSDTGFNLGEYDAHLDWVNDIDNASNKIEAFGEKIKGVFGDVKKWLGEYATLFTPTFESWKTAFGGLGEPIKNAFNEGKTTIGGFWEETLKPFTSYVTDDFIPTLTNNFSENFAPIFEDITHFALKRFGDDFQWACDKIQEGVDDVIKPSMEQIKTVTTDTTDAVGDEWEKSGNKLLGLFGGFIDSLKNIWDNFYGKILKPAWDYISKTLDEIWKEHLEPLWRKLLSFFSKISEMVMTLWNNVLAPVVNWLIDKLAPKVAQVIKSIADKTKTIFGIISGVLGGIFDALGGLADFITGIFTKDWEKAWQGIKDFFKGIWDGIWSIAKGIVNLIIGGINDLWTGIYNVVSGLINGIGSIAGAIGSMFGKDWKFSMPEQPPLIPKLARGGIVDSPTYALIGEAGKEAVMPLERNTGWIDQLADKLADKISGVGGNIKLIVKLGEDAIFDKFIEYSKDKSFETNGEVVFG